MYQLHVVVRLALRALKGTRIAVEYHPNYSRKFLHNMNKTDSGMYRENKSERLNYLSYITPEVLERYAKHMKIGEIKHGRGNFKMGGYPMEEYLESLMRHLIALWSGDGTEDHASAIMFNIIGYMHEDHLCYLKSKAEKSSSSPRSTSTSGSQQISVGAYGTSVNQVDYSSNQQVNDS